MLSEAMPRSRVFEYAEVICIGEADIGEVVGSGVSDNDGSISTSPHGIVSDCGLCVWEFEASCASACSTHDFILA